MKAEFKNLPLTEGKNLKDLIDVEENHVVSKAIARGNSIQAMLLGLSAGEIISEEEYFGDTLYQVIEGNMILLIKDKKMELSENEVIMVKEHTGHELIALTDVKVMQITMINEKE